MLIRRLIHRFVFMNAVDEGGGSGGAPAPAPIEAPSPAPAPDASLAPAPSSAPEAKPATMLEALNQHFDAQEKAQPQPGQPRDDMGRFAPKTPAEEAAAAAQAAGAPAPQAPAVPAAPKPGDKPPAADDIHQMPEGLQPKAQERFRALSNSVNELKQQVEQRDTAISYVRETFQKHNIQQPQFEQAAAVIGMLNTGDLRGALAALDEQRRNIALALGEPVPGVDPLTEHPDLRQAVDAMQITERHAIELARGRIMQASQQQQHQELQQRQQAMQVEQQAVQQGTAAVDALCKQLSASDIDYPAIEAQLLPVVPQLLQGVPPARWAEVVRTQYQLIKQVAGSARQQAQPQAAGQVLRPTGQASPAAAPKSMYEAMWAGR